MLRLYIPLLAVATALSCASQSQPQPVAPGIQSLIDEGKAFEKKRRYDLARERYQQAIDSAPSAKSRGYAARTMATSLAFWGEYENAVSALEIAVRAVPTNPASWHDLGILRAKLGRTSAAESALRRARDLAPGDPRPRIALAAFLVKHRRFSEARTEYRALSKLELPSKLRNAVKRALELLDIELGRRPS